MIKQKKQQLFDILASEFRRGTWPVGTKLPRQKELAEKYSVSINVISQAIDLLKKEGYVKVRMGDGIYSDFETAQEKRQFKYSGDRIFGYYTGAKQINILMEDNLDWQIAAWDNTFSSFALANPDIELNVHYRSEGDSNNANGKTGAEYDIVIGDGRFIVDNGMVNAALGHEVAGFFYPDLYDGALLTAENFADGLFPVGYVRESFCARPGVSAPVAGEDILAYIERLEGLKAKILMRHSDMLLQSCGLPLFNREHRALDTAEKALFEDVFARLSSLYRSECFHWTHGRVSDLEELGDMLGKGAVDVVEKPQSDVISGMQEYQLSELEYPLGGHPVITPILAAVNKENCFPEEPLRLIKALLSAKNQAALQTAGVFNSIRGEIFPAGSKIKEYFEKGLVSYRRNYDSAEYGISKYIIAWELLYCMEGRYTPQESIERITRKMEYFYQHLEDFDRRFTL